MLQERLTSCWAIFIDLLASVEERGRAMRIHVGGSRHRLQCVPLEGAGNVTAAGADLGEGTPVEPFRLTLVGREATPTRPGIPGVPTPPSDPYHDASYEFDLQGAGIPPAAEMIVQAVSSPAGQTYVRVDVQVAWQPQRAASERVPAGVTAITITAQPDMNKPHDVPAPVTFTDPARVGKIVRLVDSLPLNPGGGCLGLNENGKGITLSFLGHANGPVLATASELIPSCGYVEFAIRGTDEPILSDPGSFSQKVLAIAGVRVAGLQHARLTTCPSARLSAWESVRYGHPQPLTCGVGCLRLAVRVRSFPRLIAR
jgi:hypothetical protein